MRWCAWPQLSEWHRWFAWHPVKTWRGWVWLEPVSRRAIGYECWEYAEMAD